MIAKPTEAAKIILFTKTNKKERTDRTKLNYMLIKIHQMARVREQLSLIMLFRLR